MPKRMKKPAPRKVVLRLPDLDQSAVLNSLSSPRSRRNYKFAMEQFITWLTLMRPPSWPVIAWKDLVGKNH